MNKKVDYPRIKETLSLIQELMNYLINDLSRIEIYNEYKSSIAAETLLRLIWRNVEAILYLVSCDIHFLPSALIISRTLLEAYSKLGVADLQYESLKMQFLKHWLRLVSRCM